MRKLHYIATGNVAFARLLNSPESKQQLASAMANPIRQRLDYQSVFRRGVVVEPIPEGALPNFPDFDINITGRTVIPEFEITTSNFTSFLTDNFIFEVSFEKPSNNKFRYIANEELQKWPLLGPNDIYIESKPEYVGNIPQRSDIEVGRYVPPGTFV